MYMRLYVLYRSMLKAMKVYPFPRETNKEITRAALIQQASWYKDKKVSEPSITKNSMNFELEIIVSGVVYDVLEISRVTRSSGMSILANMETAGFL